MGWRSSPLFVRKGYDLVEQSGILRTAEETQSLLENTLRPGSSSGQACFDQAQHGFIARDVLFLRELLNTALDALRNFDIQTHRFPFLPYIVSKSRSAFPSIRLPT